MSTQKTDPEENRWDEKVGQKEKRKLRARQAKKRSIWFGLGTFGVVGYSIAVPALLGLLLGIWLDRSLPIPYSWKLMLFIGGLLLGCYNVWRWLNYESGVIKQEEADKEETHNNESEISEEK
ncbi:MAG: AtpZ/AtpI family protein [Chloroflexota bacterium]